MSQPVILADEGLEMVVDFRPFKAIENFVDVGLPFVGGLEIPKREGGFWSDIHGPST